MWEKFIVTEKDYEYLTKGIAIGVGIGIIIGALAEDVIFFFSLGGVLGVVGASIFSVVKKLKIDKLKEKIE